MVTLTVEGDTLDLSATDGRPIARFQHDGMWHLFYYDAGSWKLYRDEHTVISYKDAGYLTPAIAMLCVRQNEKRQFRLEYGNRQ